MTNENPTPEANSLVSLAYASKVLGVIPMTLRRWINAGKLQGVRVGKFYRVKLSDVFDIVQPVQAKSSS